MCVGPTVKISDSLVHYCVLADEEFNEHLFYAILKWTFKNVFSG